MTSACASAPDGRHVARNGRGTARLADRLAVATAVVALGACADARQVSDSGFGAYEASLAVWDDGLAVGWYDTRDGNAEIYVRLIDADARPRGADQRLTRTARAILRGRSRGNIRRVCRRVVREGRGRLVARTAGLVGSAGQGRPGWVQAIGNPEALTRNPVVRAFRDTLGLAWSDDSEVAHEIYLQTFDASGAALTPPTRLTRNATSSWIPAIRPWRGGFAIAWNERARAQGAHGPRSRSEVLLAIVP